MIWSIALITTLLAPLVGVASTLWIGRGGRAGRTAGAATTAAMGVATVGALVLVGGIAATDGGVVATDLPLGLHIDRPAALLLAIVLATATTIASFSTRSLDDDGRMPRYFVALGTVVVGSALVVVPGSGALLLAGWIASGWGLVALVGYARQWSQARTAQRRIARSLIVGDAALVAAALVAWIQSDGFFGQTPGVAIDQLQASTVLGVDSLHIVAVLLVVAGASRSALLPFHRWLIGTIAAPSPVSAIVHAGFVSAAGLLLIRFAPAFVASTPAVTIAFVLGVTTALLALAAGSLRSDVKGGLAWSTVGQMAFMVVQCAVGAFSSAVFHIAGHGMYKAALFLGAGDTVSASLRNRRGPVAAPVATPPVRWAASAIIATGAVAAAMVAIPPDVGDAGLVLIAAFAWVSIAAGVSGWLARGPLAAPMALTLGAAVAFLGAFTYVAGLRVTEWFVKPALPADLGTAIGAGTLIVVLGMVAIVVVLVRHAEPLDVPALGSAAQRVTTRLATPAPVASAPLATSSFGAPASVDEATKAEIRAEVVSADDVCSPLWPLASFVAVNPLGGLESAGFDDATRLGRRWLGAKTHLSLAEFRDDHERGVTTPEDLELAAIARFPGTASTPPVVVGDKVIDPVDVMIADLLHGPESNAAHQPRTTLERHEGSDGELGAVIDAAVFRWLVLRTAPPAWPVARPDETFVALAKRLAGHEPALGRSVSPSAAAWLDALDDDPAAVIASSFALVGVDDRSRSDEMRGHVARLAGWAGFAKWRKAWAHAGESLPSITPVELIAVRAMLEAAVLGPVDSRPVDLRPAAQPSDVLLEVRSLVVADALELGTGTDVLDAVRNILAEVPDEARAAVWLEAQEHRAHDDVLSLLDRPAAEQGEDRPDAQAVFCIDVRSEGVRRRLEESGNVQTLGFAGFFGVPMAIRKLGWEHEEARCPVLVSPAVTAHEHPTPDGVGISAGSLSRRRMLAGAGEAHRAAKKTPGSAFVLAETLGWLLGPVAALKTLLPGRAAAPAPVATRMAVDEAEALVEQRVFLAESVLRTMGLVGNFAPVVALCGHTSVTTNNPHATALECGACAGASGDDNARAVATLLNAADVRHGLVERGIAIPDDTWFVAGLHDTASDHITLIDVALAPATHTDRLDQLQRQLGAAGAARAAERAIDLPGPDDRVRDRGADWAQVRPEWGLARNAAFVIGPRSITAGLDLDGRAFLHEYDASIDPTGRVLETIMTAPLVVAHWISSQYYFSTVDPERFGAGDKLLHNPIGSVGVVSGDGGDLRVGLPLQSTHVDGERHHQPVRLMAVIQADIVDIERIIVNNPILQTLTEGAWIKIAARSNPGEAWSIRTADGRWSTAPTGGDLVEPPRVGPVTEATT